MKAINRTGKMTKRAMIRPLFQAYVEPPHCSARRREIKAGRKQIVPRGSSWSIFSRVDFPAAAMVKSWRRTRRMIATVTAPMGRLI